MDLDTLTKLPIESHIIAAAAFVVGVIFTALICSSSKKSRVAKITTELEAEKNRTSETKQRLASTQKDLQILRDSEAALKQNEISLNSKLTANQLVKPIATTLEKVEKRIGELESSRVADHTSLKQQVQQLMDAQKGFQLETVALVNSLRQPDVEFAEPSLMNDITREPELEKPLSIPKEASKPIDTIVADEDSNDFSDSLAVDFEGFTSESPGDGI